MHLKRLELYGFKSFADRTEFAFDSGITGIVGPNGSGKSNIADAVRWVLGEQSARTLRGNRMEDIIFSGTENRKALGFCEVSLLFDNADHSLPVDFNEVAVTRRVYRNGESEYALNKTPCRLKDIVEMFRDTGIGKEGYSLIGQGRIDEILSARSEDRRQVFEEAVGIARYKARKEEAEKRMDATRQNMVRLSDVLEEVERQLAPLEEQAAVARRYLALTSEQRTLDVRFFLHEQARIAERQTLINGQMQDLALLRRQIDGAMAAAAKERDEAIAALDALEENAASLRADKTEATRAYDAAQGQKQLDAEREAGLVRDIERLEAELNQNAEAMETAQHQNDADLLKAQREELARIHEAHEQAEDRAAQCAQALAEREEALEALKARRIDAMARAADRQAGAARLDAMRESLAQRLLDVLAELNEAKSQTQGFARAQQETENARDAALTALVQAQERRAAAQKMSDEAAVRIEELYGRKSALEGNARELASRERMLSDMARDYEGYQNSVRSVMKYARQQRREGIHGVVAELIRVPGELESAIDMALGAGMQNIIVEREEDAKALIDYLRTNKLGRATFLPLSAMRPRTLTSAEREVLSMPGCLGAASELVTYDKHYQAAIENLLGRTVIADNLENGIAIMRRARHAFRLVTLNGDVMHSGGSMTGGSQQSRATGLLSRERELGDVRKARESNRREAEQVEQAHATAVSERAGLKERVAALYEEERQAEIGCAREVERCGKAQDEKSAHLRRVEGIQEETEALRGQIDDIADELTAAQNDASEEISQEVLVGQITQQQAGLAEARHQADEAREQATLARVRAAEATRELEAADRDARRQRDEVARLNQRAGQLAAERDGAAQVLEKQRRAMAQGDADATAAEERMRRLSDELETLEQRRIAAFRREREAGEKTQALTADAAEQKDRDTRLAMQLERLDAEQRMLAERIWNEYELTLAGAREACEQAGDAGEPFDARAASSRLAKIRAEVRDMGSINVNAVEEYAALRQRRDGMQQQCLDLEAAEADLQRIIEDLTKRMRAQFIAGMAELNRHFERVFARLFRGGSASLLLQDEHDPLSSGIDIVAQLPGKKTQLLSLLSGGERALTAIAILFAMLCVKPTPFCILDEIEAALDEANIATFADVLAEFSQNTQFVVVTHRKGTMERCDGLYGIAMEEKGVSRLVSVRLAEVS